MKTFEIPYSYSAKGYHILEAENKQEAIKEMKNNLIKGFDLGWDQCEILFNTMVIHENEIVEIEHDEEDINENENF